MASSTWPLSRMGAAASSKGRRRRKFSASILPPGQPLMALARAMLEGPGAAVREDVQGAHSVRSWLPTWALCGASTPAWSDHTLQWLERTL